MSEYGNYAEGARAAADVKVEPKCETCGHRLYRSSYGWPTEG